MLNTKIEWAHHSWNPWTGCTKVSPACQNCYMYAGKKRAGQDATVVTRSKTTFLAPLERDKHGAFKMAAGERVFTCSWSDFFHADADSWRDDAWEVIRQRPDLTFLVLTKRPERILSHLPTDWGSTGWPNVWLGTTCESNAYYTRLTHLRAVPARVRFVSAEPLLGDVSDMPLAGISWVISGGESGSGHRPVDPTWIRGIRDRCASAGVAHFFKQWGGNVAKSGGRMLDGVEWSQFPATPGAVSPIVDRLLAALAKDPTVLAEVRGLIDALPHP